MSRKLQWFGMSCLVFALIVAVTPLGLARGGKGKDKDKKPMTAIETLILAAKLEAYGRESKSPAALLGAGELYWSIVPKSITELKDVEVKTEDIEGEKGDPATEEAKLQDPRDTAKELFELAQDYAKPNEKAGVNELIKGIKGTLGSMGGPRTFNKRIGGKQVQTMNLTFAGKAWGQVGLRCNSMIPLHIHVLGPGVHRQDNCVYTEFSWFAPKQGQVEVRIHNHNKQAAAYTIFVN